MGQPECSRRVRDVLAIVICANVAAASSVIHFLSLDFEGRFAELKMKPVPLEKKAAV
ncbi:hypothetical protein CCACVL1_12937 [Corchorus capsularis]|uniref:Uncharacterized protein n=1 Tax=Corchorus capsularis TaxID=210143 RepID=A0A1R3ID19_COCAP|nr:hypothetical protein CCACVL1_12937 [Corchorus capsularis]